MKIEISLVSMAELSRAMVYYECAEVCLQSAFKPIRDQCERETFAKHKKHSSRVMGYRVCQLILPITTYLISSYSFRRNYSFLNTKIQRSQYIKPKVTVHKCAETIQGRKLYEEIRNLDLLNRVGQQYLLITKTFSCPFV